MRGSSDKSKKKDFNQVTLYSCYIGIQVVIIIVFYAAMPSLLSSTNANMASFFLACFCFLMIFVGCCYYVIADTKVAHQKESDSENTTLLYNHRDQSYKKIRETYRLTRREEEVLRLLANGFSRQAIADKLFVSQNTVGAHIKSIYSKTHCNKRDEVIRLLEAYEKE